MKHIIQIEIDWPDTGSLNEVRNEIVGAVEDFTESYRPPYSISVGELEAIETARHMGLIELARDNHCAGSDDSIEVDDNARLSEGEDGIWVQGWLFLSNDELTTAGISNPKAAVDVVDSEGGHCD